MEQIGNKRCHYVQQARLKQFARTEGNNYKLTVVDLDRKKIGTRNVDRAFYSKGLYTDRVEEKLNRCVEAPGMQVFGKIYESICHSTWEELCASEDQELSGNALDLHNTMTMLVRSDAIEFVVNDIGSVTERIECRCDDRDIVKKELGKNINAEITDEMVDKWIAEYRFLDTFTFIPISSHLGVVTLNPIWTLFYRVKRPGIVHRTTSHMTLDPVFYRQIFEETGIHSDFIENLFLPCANVYKSQKITYGKPEDMAEMVAHFKSPEDVYIYPVVNLELQWAEYLNCLTINEAQQYFGFGSILDGKMSLSTYMTVSTEIGNTKHDLGWIDWNADWTEPLN